MRYYMSSNVGTIGPIDAHEVRARIQGPHGPDPSIQVCVEGTQNWGPVAHFPEFSDLFRGVGPAVAGASAQVPRAKKPTNYWAWGLVLTLLIAAALGTAGLIAGGLLLAYSVSAKLTGLRSPFTPFAHGAIGWKGTIGGVLVGLLVMFVGVGVIATKDKEAKAAAALAAQEAEAKAAEDKRREANVSKFSEALAGWQKELEKASEIEPLENLQTKSRDHVKENLPVGFESPELATFQSDLSAKLEPLLKKRDVVRLSTTLVQQRENVSKLAQSQDWITADEVTKAAFETVEKLKQHGEEFVKKEGKPGFSLEREIKTLEALKKKIEPKAEKDRAYAKSCGDPPPVDGWDRGNFELEGQLKRTAHDPSSIDVENCTQPVLMTERCWQLTCDVLGKNAFGAQVRNRKKFFYSKAGGFSE